MTLHKFEANKPNGEAILMEKYKGKVILIVNTATKCGLTPQFSGLELLHEKYKSDGLVVLGFPCNQFGKQEPGDAKEIKEGCLINYGVSFLMMSKVDVNGEHAHPVFRYLKSELPGFITRKIKWNFTKFLIGKDGKAIKRYAPLTKPEQLESDIVTALSK